MEANSVGFPVASRWNDGARLSLHFLERDAFARRASLVELSYAIGCDTSRSQTVDGNAVGCDFTRQCFCPTHQREADRIRDPQVGNRL